MTNHSANAAAARELESWFSTIMNRTEKTLFAIMPEGPHRRAFILDILRRQSRSIVSSDLDEHGGSYSNICFFLTAASKYLGISLVSAHWSAAIENVLRLDREVCEARTELQKLGLDVGSSLSIFKNEFDEAIGQSGLLADTGNLSKHDSEVALGLAVNWGLRLLLAYALAVEGTGAGETVEKGIGWIRSNLISVNEAHA